MLNNIVKMLVDLLNRDFITAKELSQKLEISQRTVYRYVEELSLANIPIICSTGRHGGIRIGDEYKLPYSYLTNDEKDMIITSLHAMDGGLNKKAQFVADKISALKKYHAKDELRKDTHFLVDSSSSPNDNRIQDKINSVMDAYDKKTAIAITYHSRNGSTTQRIVEPYTMVYRDSVWYAYCFCRLRNEMRMFKISRMTHIQKTFSTYEIKTHESEWDLSDKEEPTYVNLILKVNDKARYDVEEWLGVENVARSGRKDEYIADSKVQDNLATLTKLFSFGTNIEIVSPLSLKEKLFNACTSIVKQ